MQHSFFLNSSADFNICFTVFLFNRMRQFVLSYLLPFSILLQVVSYPRITSLILFFFFFFFFLHPSIHSCSSTSCVQFSYLGLLYIYGPNATYFGSLCIILQVIETSEQPLFSCMNLNESLPCIYSFIPHSK